MGSSSLAIHYWFCVIRRQNRPLAADRIVIASLASASGTFGTCMYSLEGSGPGRGAVNICPREAFSVFST